MEKRRSGLLRAPLGHWLIALILAAAVAWGVRFWLGYKSAQSAQTATLSWDAGAARQMDPDLASTAEPAVAMADSILSDPVIARLAQSASLPSSASPARIGEFRSRLELRQSSARLLQVRFLDASPEDAERTTNAVAGALVAGTSPGAGAPAPGVAAASAPPAATPTSSAPSPATPPHIATPPAAPAKTPVADSSSEANGTLARALGQLQAELSSTQQKLDGLSSGEGRQHEDESSAYRESKQQQLLTAEVGAALKKIADLRADPASGAKAQGPLRRIQEALLSVWPASKSGHTLSTRLMGFNAAGVDAGRLRQERAEFAHVLEVVRKEYQTEQRQESVEAATSAPPPPAPSPAAPSTSSSAAVTTPPAVSTSAPATPEASSSSATAPIAESEIPQQPSAEPFRLLRPAGSPSHSPWWPAVLAGLCCGTLYLGAAGLRYRDDQGEDEETDYAGESALDSNRLITPSKPLRPADFFGTAEVRPAEMTLPHPQIESPDPPVEFHQERTSEISYEGTPMTGDAMKRPFREETAAPVSEGDPWVDNIMKSLSETSIAKMFESPAPQDRKEDPAANAENRSGSDHPDRMAG